MVSVTHNDIIKFIQNQIVYRFEIPEIIMTNQDIVFTYDKVVAFAQQFGIKIVHSTSYYAQDNKQAEATNKIIIHLIKKFV